MQSALLILNGELEASAEIRRLARRADLMMAADGGVRHFRRLKIKPDIVIGDMDSLPPTLPRSKKTAYYCEFEQDRSDFEKALHYLSDIGVDTVWIAAGFGGRLDHTLINMGIAESFSLKLNLSFIGKSRAYILTQGRHVLHSRKGATLSLLSAGRSCTVTTQGLKFPLKNELLKKGGRGLSNKTLNAHPIIRIERGCAWAIFPG